MTKKQKYLYIVLPFFILNIIINFYVKDDNTHPPVKEYLLNDFEKTEYQVKDLVTGEVLGGFNLTVDENISFSINGKSSFGKLMIGEFGWEYDYGEIDLSNITNSSPSNNILDFIEVSSTEPFFWSYGEAAGFKERKFWFYKGGIAVSYEEARPESYVKYVVFLKKVE